MNRVGEAASAAANDILDQATEKRRQAEMLSSLMAHPGWAVFDSYVNAEANMYVAQLLDPLKVDFQAHYLRGIVKGFDLAKTLPERILRIYTDETNGAANPRHDVPEGADAGMRLSPVPEEAK